MPEFSYQVRTVGSVSIVEACGDVDMSVSAQLAEILSPLIKAGNVVLDCTRVTFCDSMGLRAAVQARQEALEAGTTFALVPSEPVSRVLRLAGVTQIFTIYDDPSQAAG